MTLDERPVLRWHFDRFECVLHQEDEHHYRGCVLDRGEALACVDIVARLGEYRARAAVESLAASVQRPPGVWNIEGEPLTDVLLVPAAGHPPESAGRLDRPVRLTDGIEVLPGHRVPADLIMQACDDPGRNRPKPIDLRGHPLYAIVRYDAPRDQVYRWDPDERLRLCLSLSRLVHPTSAGLRYAVRVLGNIGSPRHEIIPGPTRCFGAHAWTMYPDRDWLTPAEIGEWAVLVQAFEASPIPRGTRLHQALWYFEYTALTRRLHVRVPLVAMALEGLLGTRSDNSTRQFRIRAAQLAERLRMVVSEKDAGDFWRLRSKMAHGAVHKEMSPEQLELYSSVEALLREALRQSILDPALRNDLADAEAVDLAFPVPEAPERLERCPGCNTLLLLPKQGTLSVAVADEGPR